jgi:hypothetical protein
MKKKKTARKPFRLSGKAGAMLNRNLAELRRGILNVCELHSYDAEGAMDKANFETSYIERVLGQPITAVSASIQAMTASLAKQAAQQHNMPAEGEGGAQ